MKLLIIAHSASLDSTLAKATDVPTSYLIVDMTVRSIDVLNPTGSPNLNVVAEAIAQGVRVVVTGSDDSHTRIKTTAGLTLVTFSGGLTVREAIRSWESGQFGMNGDTTKPTRREAKSDANWRKRPDVSRGVHSRTRGFARNPTPRGRHHLQQYAGRGH